MPLPRIAAESSFQAVEILQQNLEAKSQISSKKNYFLKNFGSK